MSLSNIWSTNKSQLIDKKVSQVISFAGNGVLNDGSSASIEFRDFLKIIPSNKLVEYANECLQDKFTDAGFVLQDIVNEIGNRIGFKVDNGVYRGSKTKIGYDGLWKSPESHYIVVEVKTTDAYRIDLEKIARYRERVVSQDGYRKDNVSILIVVGRQDTGDLEAQVRGSRHAWDIRLISIEALLRLMSLKEDLDDPEVSSKIFQILIPREYTKLDEIIEVIFSTAEGVKQSEEVVADELDDKSEAYTKIIPVSFREECVEFIQKHMGTDLVKRTKTGYSSVDGRVGLICAISKEYKKSDKSMYWFAFHPVQKEFLNKYRESYVAFGCGSQDNTMLFPFSVFSQWLDKMNTTQIGDRSYYHVHLGEQDGVYTLYLKADYENPDVTEYKLKPLKK